MTILDGKALSQKIRDSLKEEVRKMEAEGRRAPHLAAVLVGHDPASETYVSSKIKSCSEAGFGSTLLRFEASISEEELLQAIDQLNENVEIDGFIVQLPLPKHIDNTKVINRINPAKDVDGFHPANVGLMVKGLPALLPATPYGILKLLEEYEIPTSGKHCVVIGRSQIVGSPMSILMARAGYPGNATVTLCHRNTENLAHHTLQADIIIAAAGIPRFIKADMVKEGAVIIDVGINRIDDATRKSGFRLVGDVDFEEVKDKCSYITPVPGGVGPMTIASLLLNTLQAAQAEMV